MPQPQKRLKTTALDNEAKNVSCFCRMRHVIIWIILAIYNVPYRHFFQTACFSWQNIGNLSIVNSSPQPSLWCQGSYSALYFYYLSLWLQPIFSSTLIIQRTNYRVGKTSSGTVHIFPISLYFFKMNLEMQKTVVKNSLKARVVAWHFFNSDLLVSYYFP